MTGGVTRMGLLDFAGLMCRDEVDKLYRKA